MRGGILLCRRRCARLIDGGERGAEFAVGISGSLLGRIGVRQTDLAHPTQPDIIG